MASSWAVPESVLKGRAPNARATRARFATSAGYSAPVSLPTTRSLERWVVVPAEALLARDNAIQRDERALLKLAKVKKEVIGAVGGKGGGESEAMKEARAVKQAAPMPNHLDPDDLLLVAALLGDGPPKTRREADRIDLYRIQTSKMPSKNARALAAAAAEMRRQGRAGNPAAAVWAAVLRGLSSDEECALAPGGALPTHLLMLREAQDTHAAMAGMEMGVEIIRRSGGHPDGGSQCLRAMNAFRESADQGVVPAMHHLAYLLEFSARTAGNEMYFNQARAWYALAAKVESDTDVDLMAASLPKDASITKSSLSGSLRSLDGQSSVTKSSVRGASTGRLSTVRGGAGGDATARTRVVETGAGAGAARAPVDANSGFGPSLHALGRIALEHDGDEELALSYFARGAMRGCSAAKVDWAKMTHMQSPAMRATALDLLWEAATDEGQYGDLGAIHLLAQIHMETGTKLRPNPWYHPGKARLLFGYYIARWRQDKDNPARLKFIESVPREAAQAVMLEHQCRRCHKQGSMKGLSTMAEDVASGLELFGGTSLLHRRNAAAVGAEALIYRDSLFVAAKHPRERFRATVDVYDEGFPACKVCGLVRYCSATCQRGDAAKHAQSCQADWLLSELFDARRRREEQAIRIAVRACRDFRDVCGSNAAWATAFARHPSVRKVVRAQLREAHGERWRVSERHQGATQSTRD